MDRLRLIAFSRSASLAAAEREGHFAREAIEIAFAQSHGSAPQIDALLRGEHDIAHTAPDNVVMRIDRGEDDLAIVCVAELGITQRLVVAADVATALDLRGRVLGVDAVESGYATLLYAMLERRGVPRDAYRAVSVGGTAERLAALQAGEVAGAMLSPPHDGLAISGGARVLANAADDFPWYPGTGVTLLRSWARAHADLVRRYCRALLRGARASGPAPSVSEMREALGRVVALRHGGDAAGVDRYFDASYVDEVGATS